MDVECIDLIDSDEDEKKNILHGQIFGNDQMIRCNLCLDPGLLPVEEDRAAHRTAVHADKLFYCDACDPHEKGGRGFENFDEVVKHVCKENGIQPKDTKNVWDMIRIPKNVDGLKIFTCLFCSGEGMKFVGMKEDNFLEHIRTQHGKAARRRPEKLHRECRICGESFENDLDLTEHVQTYISNVTRGSSKKPKFVGFGQRTIDDFNDTSEDDMTIVEEPRGKRKKVQNSSSCSDDEVVLKKKKKSKKNKKNKDRIEGSHRTSAMPRQISKHAILTKDDPPARMQSIRDVIIRCIFCSEKVVDLNEHLFIHHSYQCFQCAVCSKTKLFIDIDSMLKHSREVHNYRTPLEQGKIILPRHLALISCGFCDPPEIFIGKELGELTMSLFQHLEIHEHIHHGKDEIIEKKVLHNCRLCPDRDFELADLDGHIAKHCVVESSSPGPSVSRQPRSPSPRFSASRRPLSPVPNLSSGQPKSSRRPTSPPPFIDHGTRFSPRQSSSRKRSQSPGHLSASKRYSPGHHSSSRRPSSPDSHGIRRPLSPGHHSSRRPKSPDQHHSSRRPISPNSHVSKRPPSDHRSSRRPPSPEFVIPGSRKSDHYEPSNRPPSPIHHGSRKPGSSGDYRPERLSSPGSHRSHGGSRRPPSPTHYVSRKPTSPDMNYMSSRIPASSDDPRTKRHSSPSFHGSRKPLSPGHRSSRRPSSPDHHSSRRPPTPPYYGSRKLHSPIHHESPKHDKSSHSPGYYGSKPPFSGHHDPQRPPSPHSHRSSRRPESPDHHGSRRSRSPRHYRPHKRPHSREEYHETKDKGGRDARVYETSDHKRSRYPSDDYKKSRHSLDESSRSKYNEDKEIRRPSYNKNDFKMPSELKPIKDNTSSNTHENFDCRYCGDTFVAVTEAESHLKKHHKEKLGEEFEQADLLACLVLPKELQQVSCKFCDMKTMISNDIKPVLAKLRGHKMESHKEEGCSILTCFSVACRVCNLRYEDLSHSNDMNSHVATHSKEGLASSRICNYCFESFHIEEMGNHMIKNHKDQMFLCHLCKNPYHDLGSIIQHLDSDHNRLDEESRIMRPDQKTIINCRVCMIAFYTDLNDFFIQHFDKIHKGKSKIGNVDFSCRMCQDSSVFSSSQALKDHILLAHLDNSQSKTSAKARLGEKRGSLDVINRHLNQPKRSIHDRLGNRELPPEDVEGQAEYSRDKHEKRKSDEFLPGGNRAGKLDKPSDSMFKPKTKKMNLRTRTRTSSDERMTGANTEPLRGIRKIPEKKSPSSSAVPSFSRWNCPDCNFVNFERNTECRKCQKPKPKSTPGGAAKFMTHSACITDDFRAQIDLMMKETREKQMIISEVVDEIIDSAVHTSQQNLINAVLRTNFAADNDNDDIVDGTKPAAADDNDVGTNPAGDDNDDMEEGEYLSQDSQPEQYSDNNPTDETETMCNNKADNDHSKTNDDFAGDKDIDKDHDKSQDTIEDGEIDEEPASPEYNISSDDECEEDSNAQDKTTEDPGNEDSNAAQDNTEDPDNEDSNTQDNTEDPDNEDSNAAQDNTTEDQDELKQIEESSTDAGYEEKDNLEEKDALSQGEDKASLETTDESLLDILEKVDDGEVQDKDHG